MLSIIVIWCIGTATCIAIIWLAIAAWLRSTVRECHCRSSQAGRTMLVTGASSGIGLEVARELAARGARVLLGCRDKDRAEAARAYIIASTNNSNVEVLLVDLASLQSVRNCAEQALRIAPKLDVLVNNAGVYGASDRLTRDGFVEGAQVNHLGPFLLTLLLLPALRAARGRVVAVSSILHWFGSANGTETWRRAGARGSMRTYCDSKLCNVIFSVELSRRERGVVLAHAVHPGVLKTRLTRDLGVLDAVGFRLWAALCHRTTREAAQCPVHAAVAAACGTRGGRYLTDCEEWPARAAARDPVLAARLWRRWEEFVGQSYELVPQDRFTNGAKSGGVNELCQ